MKPDFKKINGLLPVVIQDNVSLKVLMLGYMNEEAFNRTCAEKYVTFYSRSRNELWTKGLTSGNYFHVKTMHLDCDDDALLIRVTPEGPACHTGQTSCFGATDNKGFLYILEKAIEDRIITDSKSSYTNTLFRKGINKIAQKVGEEAVELVIEAKDSDIGLFKNEAADLLYHFLILLHAKDVPLGSIEDILAERNKRP